MKKVYLVLLSVLAALKRIASFGHEYGYRFRSSTRSSSVKSIRRAGGNPLFMSTSAKTEEQTELFKGNPVGKALWEWTWRQKFMKPSKQGESPTKFGDAATVLRNNIEQVYGGAPSIDGAPVAEGEAKGMLEGSLFLGLQTYYEKYGGVFKLLFGPKSFLVVSDPTIVKHLLRDNAKAYDKGILAEILEPIMGKGLIPADPETWKARRRAIVPGFHKAWYNRMIKTFIKCNEPLVDKLERATNSGEVLNMETEFCSVALDIIGKAVFNYEFGSVTKESPVIEAVYSTLKEAEHRSITPVPYWNFPLANTLVPRLRKFNADLKILDDVLDELIVKALAEQSEASVEELENRDYDSMENPSLLKFLVDIRGEESTSVQLRDDLMTMLIAGHETTAAVLTWALFELAQKPEVMKKAQRELDDVLGDRMPTFEDIPKLQYIRLIVSESLRMYPEPPLLIRRALEDDVLPQGGTNKQGGFPILRGTDIFIALYNIHRSEEFWENPNDFNPDRFLKEFKNPDRPDWEGYRPQMSTMYPNEVHSDFAFLPFGGGNRKCVGDQFACMEAVITLAMVLKRYDFEFAMDPKDVGIYTGATIHTRNGLKMRVKKRRDNSEDSSVASAALTSPASSPKEDVHAI